LKSPDSALESAYLCVQQVIMWCCSQIGLKPVWDVDNNFLLIILKKCIWHICTHLILI